MTEEEYYKASNLMSSIVALQNKLSALDRASASDNSSEAIFAFVHHEDKYRSILDKTMDKLYLQVRNDIVEKIHDLEQKFDKL